MKPERGLLCLLRQVFLAQRPTSGRQVRHKRAMVESSAVTDLA